MYKILFVVAIALIPFEVLADDGKLQTMADIVQSMNTSRLCDYECVPGVTIDGTNLTVSFTTTITDTSVDTGKILW